MKICFLLQDFFPTAKSGLEYQTFYLAKELLAKGHKVHIVTQQHTGTRSIQQYEGMKVHRIPRGTIPVLSTYIYFQKALKKVVELEPDIVHEQGISGLGAVIKHKTSIPVVSFGRGNDVYNTSFFFKHVALTKTLRSVDRILAQTYHMKQQFSGIVPECSNNITVVPNGIHCSKQTHSENDTKKFRLVNVNRLIKDKAIDELIETILLLREQMNAKDFAKIRLDIIGDGPERERLEKQVQSDNLNEIIHFLGALPHDITLQRMQKATVYVTPTYHNEGFPNVLLEAMLSRLPIIATNHLAIPEIVQEGKNGLLVPIHSPEKTAKAIEKLFRDQSLRTKIAQYNAKNIHQYDWKNTSSQIESVYDDIYNN